MMLHLLPFIVQIKVRENRKGNQEGNSEKPATLGTIHRSNIKTKHGKLNRSTRTAQQIGDEPSCSLMFVIRNPPCNS